MSYYDDSSLFVAPNGYKTSVLFAQKPMDANGQLAFTRSNDTATRVGPDGLIEKVRTNVLLQSNSFNTTWTTSNASVTSGQSGYDGSSNAWLLESSIDGSAYVQQLSAQAGVQTFSFYAKAGTTDWVRVIGDSSPDYLAFFDLTNGVVGATLGGANIDASIESVGGGWYRCSVAGNGTISRIIINVAEADNDILVSTGDNILIQAAQLETGDIATNYIPTTTTAVSVGPVANLPRIDYTGGGCGKLLLEPQRTNLETYSEQFDNAAWSLINATITPNADISPDGYTNADRIYDDAGSGQHRVGKNISVVSATTYTFSVFAKKGSLRYCYLLTVAGGTSDRYYFDLQDGVSITAGGKIEDYGSGWYRISAQVTAAATGNELFTFNLTDSSSSPTYSGTGTGYHMIYGYQVEAGSYATSYIPTLGAAVTRGADACSKTGISSLIGQTQGTLFFEFEDSDYSFASIARAFAISDGTYDNRIYLSQLSSGAIYCVAAVGGSTNMEIQEAAPSGRRNTIKAALAYKNNDFVLYVNGTNAGTDTSSAVPACSNLYLGQEIGLTANSLNKPYKQALLFKTRLTNQELQDLTTL